jgi:hypothetical protein
MRARADREDTMVQIGAIVLTFGLIVGLGTLLIGIAGWLVKDLPSGWAETYFSLLVAAGTAVALWNHFKSRPHRR